MLCGHCCWCLVYVFGNQSLWNPGTVTGSCPCLLHFGPKPGALIGSITGFLSCCKLSLAAASADAALARSSLLFLSCCASYSRLRSDTLLLPALICTVCNIDAWLVPSSLSLSRGLAKETRCGLVPCELALLCPSLPVGQLFLPTACCASVRGGADPLLLAAAVGGMMLGGPYWCV